MQELNLNDLSWCVRRMPRALVALMKKHGPKVMLAGGYIRSRVTNEDVKDIDLFVADEEFGRALALEYVEGQEKHLHKTDNAYTVKFKKPTVQVIYRWLFNSAEEILQSFDFTIACAVLWWDGTKWQSLCHESYYPDLAAKRLVYTSPQRNEDAGGSILRVLKFYQRGYRIPLDSFGAVIARLMSGVKLDKIEAGREETEEQQLAKVLTGLLREVDPNIDPDHVAHLPSAAGSEDIETKPPEDAWYRNQVPREPAE